MADLAVQQIFYVEANVHHSIVVFKTASSFRPNRPLLLQFFDKRHGSSHFHRSPCVVPNVSRGNDVRSTGNGSTDLYRVFKILHRHLASGVKTFARGRCNINKSYQVVEVISGLIGAFDRRNQIIEIRLCQATNPLPRRFSKPSSNFVAASAWGVRSSAMSIKTSVSNRTIIDIFSQVVGSGHRAEMRV